MPDVDPSLRVKNETIMKLGKKLATQQKSRRILKERIEKLEETVDLDALYN